MNYVYVLRSLKDSKLYIGVSANVDQRLNEHNKGKNKSTKYRRPFKLLLTKAFETRKEAYRYEWLAKHNGQANKDLKAELAKLAKP